LTMSSDVIIVLENLVCEFTPRKDGQTL